VASASRGRANPLCARPLRLILRAASGKPTALHSGQMASELPRCGALSIKGAPSGDCHAIGRPLVAATPLLGGANFDGRARKMAAGGSFSWPGKRPI